MKKKTERPRIGIYAGTFNPVHAGHIAFALQAIKEADLDQVVFLPERHPRHKTGVEHFGHRVAMLNRAVRPYANMAVLELVEKHFSVLKTLPQLQALFPDAQLVMLMGSDTALSVPHWSHAKQLLDVAELVVGVRSEHQLADTWAIIGSWRNAPKQLHVVESFAADVSSTSIRDALRTRNYAPGLLKSVHRYARSNWLYVSLESIAEKSV